MILSLKSNPSPWFTSNDELKVDTIKFETSSRFMTDFLNNSLENGQVTLMPVTQIYDNSSDESIHEFSDGFRGFLICCYTLSCILAVFGNIISIFIFLEQQRRATYAKEIYVYLINLAVCDVLMAIFCIPFTAVNYLGEWIFPEFFCKVVLYCQMCFVFASIGTNVFVSIHKLKGILYPLDLGSHRITLASSLSVIWLTSCLISLVNFKIGGVENGKCGEINIIGQLEFAIWTYTVPILMLFLPMAVITFNYCWIGYLVFSRDSGLDTSSNSRIGEKRRVTIVLISVALCFCFAWTPLQLFFITLFNMSNDTIDYYQVQIKYIYAFCHLLAMSHSFHNPVLLFCTSKNFREVLVTLHKGRRERQRVATQKFRSVRLRDKSCQNQSDIGKNSAKQVLVKNVNPGASLTGNEQIHDLSA